MGLFSSLKTIGYSYNKSKKLLEIAKILSREDTGILDLIANRKMVNDNEIREAKEKLFDLCMADSYVRDVMEKHGVKRADLNNIYELTHYLFSSEVVNSHYLPASILSYGQTLDYLLSNYSKIKIQKDENQDYYHDWKREDHIGAERVRVVYRLLRYFEKGETGAINHYE